jgi:hypothetical protein
LSLKAVLVSRVPIGFFGSFVLLVLGCRNPSRFVQGLNICPESNRVIREVRQRQHQNPEFSHTQGEIKKNVQKSTLAFKGG